MPSDIYTAAFAYLLINEGKTYVNDPDDAGGPTRYGICLTTLQAWRVAQGKAKATAVDVQNLTEAEASQIYAANYWPKVGGDGLTDGALATALFDAAVLCGVAWVGKQAQNVANLVGNASLVVDGAVGPKSVAAINTCPRRPYLLELVRIQQSHFMDLVAAEARNRKFHKTWQKRTACYLDLNF